MLAWLLAQGLDWNSGRTIKDYGKPAGWALEVFSCEAAECRAACDRILAAGPMAERAKTCLLVLHQQRAHEAQTCAYLRVLTPDDWRRAGLWKDLRAETPEGLAARFDGLRRSVDLRVWSATAPAGLGVAGTVDRPLRADGDAPERVVDEASWAKLRAWLKGKVAEEVAAALPKPDFAKEELVMVGLSFESATGLRTESTLDDLSDGAVKIRIVTSTGGAPLAQPHRAWTELRAFRLPKGLITGVKAELRTLMTP